MTFDEIVSDVAERLNLTSTDALARIGRRVNRRYRRVCVHIGLVSFRRFSSSVSVTPGTRDQTFTGEKVLSVKVSGATLPLDSISYAEMQEIIPTTGDPTRWALKRAGATTQVIQFDSTMDDGLDLIVEVEEAGSTLSGSQVPAFPESWHDVLVFGTLADELRKKEKVVLARDAELEYERMLGQLAYHVAVNGYQDIVSGSKESTNPRGLTGAASTSGSPVTHTTGALIANELVIGRDGGGDVKSLGDLGTTAKFLRGNAAGPPTFDAVAQADVTGLTAALALKAPLASPALTGTPTSPTAAAATNTTQVATTAFVQQEIAAKAPLASPALTGVPTAPTAATLTATTQLATTAFVETEFLTGVLTMQNKRMKKRVNTIVSSATPTTNTDNYDVVNITALAAAITSMTTNLSGTPNIGDSLLFMILDNGTARAITWGASFTAKGSALPTTTVISKLLSVLFIYNGTTWGCVASQQES